MITRAPLIFTHYGNSEYLPFTLRQARRANPDMPLIFIGDDSNYDIASLIGWKHTRESDLQSSKREEFGARFRCIQGVLHHSHKGGRNWLKYVFERFFIIEKFLEINNIDWFWHFDTDTMILHDLSHYEQPIMDLDIGCTTLCEDCCPSGLIRSSTVRDFCSAIIESFRDQQFLSSLQREFDEINPRYAYTEMRAFWNFRHSSGIATRHLASLFEGSQVWFDDCVCLQTGGFVMARAEKLGRMIKDLHAASDEIFCRKDELDMNFASINCSWVSTDVFHWIEQASLGCETIPAYISEYLSFNPADMNSLQ